jgi:Coenzyme PQQ synthesis protein D (PqqD)
MSCTGPRYARAAGLEVHETDDGLIVFNPATDRVHHLNYTAGVLFELCHDARDAAELAGMMAELYALEEAPGEMVETGLRQLVAEGLLVQSRAG